MIARQNKLHDIVRLHPAPLHNLIIFKKVFHK
jgi:hypothetical protein